MSQEIVFSSLGDIHKANSVIADQICKIFNANRDLSKALDACKLENMNLCQEIRKLKDGSNYMLEINSYLHSDNIRLITLNNRFRDLLVQHKINFSNVVEKVDSENEHKATEQTHTSTSDVSMPNHSNTRNCESNEDFSGAATNMKYEEDTDHHLQFDVSLDLFEQQFMDFEAELQEQIQLNEHVETQKITSSSMAYSQNADVHFFVSTNGKSNIDINEINNYHDNDYLPSSN